MFLVNNKIQQINKKLFGCVVFADILKKEYRSERTDTANC